MSVQEILETRRVKIPVVRRALQANRSKPARRRLPTGWLALSACLPGAALVLIKLIAAGAGEV